ncbi:MAG: ferritin-like domain-containing protein [Candidatus Omnitrophota bacterium]
MERVKEELVTMLNQALELEHAARIQYLAHAEAIKGLQSEKLIERIKEIASDEEKHEEMFREMIGGYLGGIPTMGMSETHSAFEIQQILDVNMKQEKDAIDFYKKIYKKVIDNKENLQYQFEALEHSIRHIIIDEEEHVSELSLLMGI